MTGTPDSAPENRSDHDAPPILSEDRRAALRAGSTPVPRRFIAAVAAVFVVLGLGGVVLERVIGTPGASSPATLSAPTTTPSTPTSPTAILGLTTIAGRLATPFSLTDQYGRPWSLAQARGRVVILAFYNRDCNDICPVLGSELATALSLLGTHARQVTIAIVNTDPTHAGAVADPPALSVPKLAGRTNVVFLTGPLRALDPVWTHYGVEVRVASPPLPVIHSDVLYFIDPRGALRDLATPFANESRTGTESLSAASRLQFGAAVAEVAGSLLP